MKKQILILSTSLFCIASIFSQNTSSSTSGQNNGQGIIHWKLDGNTATDNNFIGTLNEKPLIFKAYGKEALRLTPEGNVQLRGLVELPGDGTDGGGLFPKMMVLKEDGTVALIKNQELFKLITTGVPDAALECGSANGQGLYSAAWRSTAGAPGLVTVNSPVDLLMLG